MSSSSIVSEEVGGINTNKRKVFSQNKKTIKTFAETYTAKKSRDIFSEALTSVFVAPPTLASSSSSSAANEEEINNQRWKCCDENDFSAWEKDDTTFRSEKAFKTFSQKYEVAFKKRHFEKIISHFFKNVQAVNQLAAAVNADGGGGGSHNNAFFISFENEDIIKTFLTCLDLIDSILKMIYGVADSENSGKRRSNLLREIDVTIVNVICATINHLNSIRLYGLLDFYTCFIYWCDENLFMYTERINPSFSQQVETKRLSSYIPFTNPIHRSIISSCVIGSLRFFQNDIETIEQYASRQLYYFNVVGEEHQNQQPQRSFDEMSVDEIVEASTQAFLGLNLDEETREALNRSTAEAVEEEQQQEQEVFQLGTPIRFDGKESSSIQPGIPIYLNISSSRRREPPIYEAEVVVVVNDEAE